MKRNVKPCNDCGGLHIDYTMTEFELNYIKDIVRETAIKTIQEYYNGSYGFVEE